MTFTITQRYCSITRHLLHRFPRSVITFASDKQKNNVHPTQKPIALIEWLVKSYSNTGDVVLDSFMGSGTTGVACKKLQRRFIGIEMNQEYFVLAKATINNQQGVE